MGLVARCIMTASLAAAGLCMSAAVSASASPAATTSCGTILAFGGVGGPSPVGSVCVSISNGQVVGFASVSGNATNIVSSLTQCDAAHTACSTVPGTTVSSLITPTVPTTPGQSYQSCTSLFTTVNGPGPLRPATGCSPLVPA
ncbi:hypothetical protein EV192_107298 [Actinocrispum wychmicini]|uniref:Secreted protein n=1 Tax=Actinocrispum wychmicini TaxID=1213861 RepID=A0A4R2JNY4_9PSEU|nr:hypothetical protein EV192_107298 [Actinocrispum wychmicini]